MALELVSPEVAFTLYSQMVEEITDPTDSATPVLAVEVEGHDHVLLMEFDIGDDGACPSLARIGSKMLVRGMTPVQALMSSEVNFEVETESGQRSGLMEAVQFIYTCKDGPEWAAAAPFTRTPEGVIWHYSKFARMPEVPQSIEPILDCLRSIVGRPNGASHERLD